MLRVKVTYRHRDAAGFFTHRDAGSFTVTDGAPNYEGVQQQYRGGVIAALAAVPKKLEAAHVFWETETPRGPVVKYPSDEWWREVCDGGHVTAVNPDYMCVFVEDNESG